MENKDIKMYTTYITKKMNFEKFFNVLKNGAKKSLKKDGHVQMCFFATKDKKFIGYPMDFKSIEEKYQKIKNVKQEIKQINPDIIGFVSETWYSTAKKNTSAYHLITSGLMPPSQDPERKEAIIIKASRSSEEKIVFIPFYREGEKTIFEEEIDPGVMFDDNIIGGFWDKND